MKKEREEDGWDQSSTMTAGKNIGKGEKFVSLSVSVFGLAELEPVSSNNPFVRPKTPLGPSVSLHSPWYAEECFGARSNFF